jgi:peroxiredoxin
MNRRNILIASAALVAVGAGASIAFLGGAPAPEPIPTSGQAPDFSVQDASGETRTLAEFRGQTVILEWTNNGCPYVRKHYDAGNMQAVQRDAMAHGVVWLQVISSAPGTQGYLDGAGVQAQLAADQATPTATLLDPDGVMGRAYGARNTPQMFIISPEGQLLYQGAIDDQPSSRPETLEGATNYVRAALADIAAGRPVQTPETTPYGCGVKYA